MRAPSQVLASVAGRWPWPILILSIAAAAASGFYASQLLRFDSDRDLVDQSPEYAARKKEWNLQFDSPSYTMVVFAAPETEAPVRPETRSELKQAVREFATWARAQPGDMFETITDRMDPAQFGDLGLLYMPYDDLASLQGRLTAARPILARVAKDPGLAGILRSVNDGWDELTSQAASASSDPPGDPPAGPPLGELRGIVDAASAACEGNSTAAPPVASLLLGGAGGGDVDPEGTLFRGNGRYALVLLDVNEDDSSLNRIEHPLAKTREGLAGVLSRHPRLGGGVTGELVMEAEEMEASMTDFERSTIATFIGVALLLLLDFRRVARPLLTLAPLLLAIVWTLGATALVLGKMNLLAMVFAIILIAMGIDYGIVVVSHYERGLRAGLTSVVSLEVAFKSGGVGLVTSFLASAAVFLSAAVTRYRGFAELGIITAMGLFLCLLAMTTTLPALLVLVDRRRRPMLEAEPSDPPAASRAPRLTSTVAVLLIVLGAAGAWIGRGITWDFNLLQLLPEGMPSVRWIQPLLDGGRPPLHAVSLARDRAELERLAERLRALAQVRDVESVFPSREEEKRTLLAELRTRLGPLEPGVPQAFTPGKLRKEAERLRTNLRDAADRSEDARRELTPMVASLGRLVSALRVVDPAAGDRLARLDEEVARALADGIDLLRKMADPGPVSPERVPAILRQDFVGTRGLLALRIYPRKNPWEWPALPEFVEAVRGVDPSAIGDAITLCHASFAIQESFRVSMGVAAAIVVLLLVVSFRRAVPVLVGLLPMAVALGLLAGVMALTGHNLNFANYFAVPILLGSGIEYDIHLVQSFRLGAGARLLKSTRWAVLLCALSTLLGFASLVPARHRGVASLGWVLTVGTILAYVCAMAIVPPAMRWLGRGRLGAQLQEPTPTPTNSNSNDKAAESTA